MLDKSLDVNVQFEILQAKIEEVIGTEVLGNVTAQKSFDLMDMVRDYKNKGNTIDWATHIAVDSDGEVYLYDDRPDEKDRYFWYNSGGINELIGRLKLPVKGCYWIDKVLNWEELLFDVDFNESKPLLPVGTAVIVDARVSCMTGIRVGKVSEYNTEPDAWKYTGRFVGPYHIMELKFDSRHVLHAFDKDGSELNLEEYC